MPLPHRAPPTVRQLLAKYDPNQPRIPAGQTGGGRWTDGDSPSETLARERRSEPNRSSTQRDATGQQPWSTAANTFDRSGHLIAQSVAMRDGSIIDSRFDGARFDAAWTSQHTVTASDGTVTIIQSNIDTQTIRDGSGQVLARAEWTPTGPVDVPIAEPATARPLRAPGGGLSPGPALLPPAAFAAGLSLYNLEASRNTLDRIAALSFRADAFQPTGVASAAHVGYLNRDELRAACPAYPTVAALALRAEQETPPRREGESAASYGTRLHLRMEQSIKTTLTRGDPLLQRARAFRLEAERSYIGGRDADYRGQLGSVRVDVFENPKNGNICVYDLKTGRRDMTPARALQIANHIGRYYGANRRILITSIRLGDLRE